MFIDESTQVSLVTYGGGAEQWGPLLGDRSDQIQIIDWSRQRSGVDELESVECLAGWKFPTWIFDALPNLKWIQAVSVGVDDFVNNPAISPSVTITNTKGIYADSIAEYVIWSLLTLSRGFNSVMTNQARRRWRQVPGDGLENKVLGIVGMGNTGLAVAVKAKAFDMRTIGIARDSDRSTAYPNVDEIMPVSALEERISEFDALALCVPLTASTRGLISKKLIEKMKHSLILVNISREEIVDYASIASALKRGKLGGAALDVFEKEPLSRWSNLWNTDNLIVTPHLCALTSKYKERIADLLCENIARYAENRSLLNVVDRHKGY